MLRCSINWCRENRYVNGEIKIKLLKEDQIPVGKWLYRHNVVNPQPQEADLHTLVCRRKMLDRDGNDVRTPA